MLLLLTAAIWHFFTTRSQNDFELSEYDRKKWISGYKNRQKMKRNITK